MFHSSGLEQCIMITKLRVQYLGLFILTAGVERSAPQQRVVTRHSRRVRHGHWERWRSGSAQRYALLLFASSVPTRLRVHSLPRHHAKPADTCVASRPLSGQVQVLFYCNQSSFWIELHVPLKCYQMAVIISLLFYVYYAHVISCQRCNNCNMVSVLKYIRPDHLSVTQKLIDRQDMYAICFSDDGSPGKRPWTCLPVSAHWRQCKL